MWRLISIIIAIVFIIACSTLSKPTSLNLLSPNQFASFIAYDRRIYCPTAISEPCGLTLRGCSDGLAYRCAINVIIFDISEMRKIVNPDTREE